MSHTQTFTQHQTESMQFLDFFPQFWLHFCGRILISTLHTFTMSHFQTISTSNRANAVFVGSSNSGRVLISIVGRILISTVHCWLRTIVLGSNMYLQSNHSKPKVDNFILIAITFKNINFVQRFQGDFVIFSNVALIILLFFSVKLVLVTLILRKHTLSVVT